METVVENCLYLALKLNDEIYAVDIRGVKIVERLMPITRVPKVASFISGVVNLRGEVVPVIDLKKKFEMAQSEITDNSRIVVMRVNEMQLGILVDSVDEVLDIQPQAVENSSTVQSSISQRYVAGLGKVGNRIITILDLEKLAFEVDM